MKHWSKILLTNTLVISAILISCQKETQQPQVQNTSEEVMQSKKPDEPGFVENNMVMYWNEKTNIIAATWNPQPVRSRFYAISQIAVHDALNAIKPKYKRFALQSTREQFANPDAAVASAAYWVLKGLNLGAAFPLDSWYSESLSTIPDGESKEQGITVGKEAADAVIANRANDGIAQVITNATSPAEGDDPGEYRITLFWSNPILNLSNIKQLTNWGTVIKPFVVQSNNQFRPVGPNPINSEAYTTDYNEVKTKGARVGHTRTPEESTIASFWEDSRPSLVWNTLTRKIISTKKLDAWKTARLFALVHTALADGMNSAMEAKYHFYFWRPETAIRLADNDANPNTAGDAGWLPSYTEVPNSNPLFTIYTPPVPEYPSSFAMNGGAAAEVLRLFFGTDEYSFDFTSLMSPGITRHYSSFSDAARENSVSKIYGGFYFRKSVTDGEEMGKQIANYVFTHAFREESAND